MTDLCVRCAYLFEECRPLLGAKCPKGNPPPPERPPEKTAAAVIQDMRTGESEIKLVRAVDFYEGRP